MWHNLSFYKVTLWEIMASSYSLLTPLATSRQRSYTYLHILPAPVRLSAHLASDCTHSTLAYDLRTLTLNSVCISIVRTIIRPLSTQPSLTYRITSITICGPVVLNMYLSLSCTMYYDTLPGAALVSLAFDGMYFSNHQRMVLPCNR